MSGKSFAGVEVKNGISVQPVGNNLAVLGQNVPGEFSARQQHGLLIGVGKSAEPALTQLIRSTRVVLQYVEQVASGRMHSDFGARWQVGKHNWPPNDVPLLIPLKPICVTSSRFSIFCPDIVARRFRLPFLSH